MSLIPFTLRNPEKPESVFSVIPQEEIKGSSYDVKSHLAIREMDKDSIGPSECNASYDLHVGDEYVNQQKRGDPISLNDKNFVAIKPGKAVIIRTKEHVNFPQKLFGILLPKVSLLQCGISNTCSKVDPGYDGTLLVTLFNLGTKTIHLKKGDPICSLCLFKVADEYAISPYTRSSKNLSPGNNPYEQPDKPSERFRNWINENSILCTCLATIFGAILSALITLLITGLV